VLLPLNPHTSSLSAFDGVWRPGGKGQTALVGCLFVVLTEDRRPVWHRVPDGLVDLGLAPNDNCWELWYLWFDSPCFLVSLVEWWPERLSCIYLAGWGFQMSRWAFLPLQRIRWAVSRLFLVEMVLRLVWIPSYIWSGTWYY